MRVREFQGCMDCLGGGGGGGGGASVVEFSDMFRKGRGLNLT